MRLLQVITDTDRRGAQVFAADLETALTRLGVQVTTRALQPGTSGAPLPVMALGRRGRSPATLLQLRHEMGAADVTIAHGSATLAACALAAAGTQHRWVYRQISDQLFWASTPFRRARVSRFLRSADAVTALSAEAKSVLVGHFHVPASRVTVIPNGVPSTRFSPADPATRAAARAALDLRGDEFVALVAGALVTEKGVDVAIDAVRRGGRTTLLIAGDGPQRGALEHRVLEGAGTAGGTAGGRPGSIRFLGSVAAMEPLYHAADVVLFPSVGGDSMPAALIESGMCALAAICTPIGAARDVVIDGQTGVVVPPGDVGALAGALALLREDAPGRLRLGAAAHEHCRRFDIDTVASQWLQVLQRVVTGER